MAPATRTCASRSRGFAIGIASARIAIAHRAIGIAHRAAARGARGARRPAVVLSSRRAPDAESLGTTHGFAPRTSIYHITSRFRNKTCTLKRLKTTLKWGCTCTPHPTARVQVHPRCASAQRRARLTRTAGHARARARCGTMISQRSPARTGWAAARASMVHTRSASALREALHRAARRLRRPLQLLPVRVLAYPFGG